ncbi:MAG TPA: amidase [Geobacteraceae bacterium]
MMEIEMTEHAAELHDRLPLMDATAMAGSLSRGEVSSYQLVMAHFDRIERYDAAGTTVVTPDRENALAAAREADVLLARGKPGGSLHGIPVTIKDAFLTCGIRTTFGHPAFSDHIPLIDAAAVSMLKSAGAVLLGKTNCATLCMDVQTVSPLFGTTSNPWDEERTSGGSSGGEAAAVALGLSPLGLGSDTAGSIRIPASYCGIYGFKPTVGKVPRQGLIPPMPETVDLDHHLTAVGPLARSVRDLLLCYRVLSGETAPETARTRAPNVAWTADFPGMPLDDEVGKVITRAVGCLRGNGISVEEKPSAIDMAKAVRSATALMYFEFFPFEKNEFLKKIFWKSLFTGGTFAYYKKLLDERMQLADELDTFLEGWDCWLVPATPTTAPRHNPEKTPVSLIQNGKAKQIGYFSSALSFTFPFNFTGHPAVVIPVGKDGNGLPVGVQLIGRRGGDVDLLQCAMSLVAALGDLPPGRPPKN